MQKPDFSTGFIEITIENPVEQRELTYAIKKTGRNIQYTLNSEVFKISPIAFFELIVLNFEKPENEFKNFIQKSIKDKQVQGKIINNSLTLRQKINKVGKEINDVGVLISLLTAAVAAL